MGWGSAFKGIGQALASGAAAAAIPALSDPGHFNPLQGGTWTAMAPMAAAGAIIGVINHFSKSPTQQSDTVILDALVNQYPIRVVQDLASTAGSGGPLWVGTCVAFGAACMGKSEADAKAQLRALVRQHIGSMLLSGQALPPAK